MTVRMYARLIAALLLAVQGWAAVSGGAGGIGCVRFWACLTEERVEAEECACCREKHANDAPTPSIPTDSDTDPGCCVTLPDLATSGPRPAAGELADVLSFALVVCVVADAAWTSTEDPCDAPAWPPPPDPVARRIAAGLPSTRLII